MKNYIQEWANGVEPEPTVSISARVNSQIVANIDEIGAEFGIKRSTVIEAALDYGTRYLLEEIERMNESNVKMVGRMAKEQGTEKEFEEMIKGSKNA